MITKFTKNDILIKKGCYTRDQILSLSFINKNDISLQIIVNSEILLKDKIWFIFNKCDLTLKEKQELSLKLSWIILPIYEQKYPKDLRIRKCLQILKKYYKGLVSITLLKETQSAAKSAAWSAKSAAESAAWSAAWSAWSAKSAAESAAWSAWSAKSAAESAAESAAWSAAWSAKSAAESAAWSAESAKYQEKIKKLLLRFIINNKN